MTSMPTLKIAIVAALCLWLWGCGQTGPLYLPEETPGGQTTGEQPTEPADLRGEQ